MHSKQMHTVSNLRMKNQTEKLKGKMKTAIRFVKSETFSNCPNDKFDEKYTNLHDTTHRKKPNLCSQSTKKTMLI